MHEPTESQRIYGISRFPTQPLILVSAGTAVTVDYIADGAFLGGAILPETALQLLALHSHTDALPHVAAITAELVAELPARSTEACIACGVLYGIVDQ
jgi:pantothenate kinase type III